MPREERLPSSGDEPILLTRASLEHVLDVFPAESGSAADDSVEETPAGAHAHIDLFASESPPDDAPAGALALIPPAPMTYPVHVTRAESTAVAFDAERPWHTYDVPAVQVTHAAAIGLPAPAGLASWRLNPKMLAAAVIILAALVAATIGGVRQRGKTMDIAAVAPAAAGTPPKVEAPAPASPVTSAARAPAAKNSAALAAAPNVQALGTPVAPAKTVPAAPGNPTGAVLKGSLTPQSEAGPSASPAVSPSAAPTTADAAPPPPVAAAAEPREIPAPRIEPLQPAAEDPRPASPPAPTPAPAAVDTTASARPSPPPAPAAAPVTPPPAPAASASPASAPAPAAPAAAATAVATEANAIQGVLGRYRRAFSDLDPNAAKAVWPTVDARMLGRAFDQLQQQQLDFQACEIAVNGGRATASCSGRARYVPKVGSKSARDESRHWTFDLRKAGDQWLIDAVTSK